MSCKSVIAGDGNGNNVGDALANLLQLLGGARDQRRGQALQGGHVPGVSRQQAPEKQVCPYGRGSDLWDTAYFEYLNS